MLEVIEAEKINVENIVKNIITESKHNKDKPLSRVSFIETPPVLCSPRNSKLEPSLDTVEEMTEIPIIQETDIAEMDKIVNTIWNTEHHDTQTVLEEINVTVEEYKSFKNKFVKFYKSLKNKFSCFVKNI